MSEQTKKTKKKPLQTTKNEDVVSVKVQYQRKIKDLQKKHKEQLRTKLKEMVQQIQNLQLQVDTLQQKVNSLQFTIDERQKKIEHLENTIDKEITKQQTLKETYENDINQYQTKINNLKNDYQNKISNLKTTNQQTINNLKDQLQQIRLQLNQSLVSYEDLSEKYNILEQQLNSQEFKIQKIKSEGYQIAMALIIQKQNMQEIKEQQREVIEKLSNVVDMQQDEILKIKAKGFDLSQQLQQTINRHNSIYPNLLSIFQEIRQYQTGTMKFDEIEEN